MNDLILNSSTIAIIYQSPVLGIPVKKAYVQGSILALVSLAHVFALINERLKNDNGEMRT